MRQLGYMITCLKKVDFQNVSEVITDLQYRVDIIEDRLTIHLWENPQWIRNKLVVDKIATLRMIDMIVKSEGIV